MTPTDNSGWGIDRRQLLAGIGTTVAGAGLFTGMATASDFRQVNFCGCSQVCFTGGDPSDYYVWVGYRADGAWEYERVIVRLANKEGGTCYTASAAESELGLDDSAEAKLIAVSDFDSPRRYIGNPNTCARKPLETFVADPPSEFNGFINDTGGDELDLEYGTFRDTEIVQSSCGQPGRNKSTGTKNDNKGKKKGHNKGKKNGHKGKKRGHDT